MEALEIKGVENLRVRNPKCFEMISGSSNLPRGTFKTHRFSTWQGQHDGFHICYRYANYFCELCHDAYAVPEDEFDGVELDRALDDWSAIRHPFLTLVGPPGVGKTHLAIAIAWDGIEFQELDTRYYQVESLLDKLRRGFSNRNGYDDVYSLLDQIKNCEVLVLDDLGAEKGTEWAIAKLDEIIDYRYINRLDTVITTNLPPSKLSDRIADRLQEGTIVQLKGESYRKKKSKARAQGGNRGN